LPFPNILNKDFFAQPVNNNDDFDMYESKKIQEMYPLFGTSETSEPAQKYMGQPYEIPSKDVQQHEDPFLSISSTTSTTIGTSVTAEPTQEYMDQLYEISSKDDIYVQQYEDPVSSTYFPLNDENNFDCIGNPYEINSERNFIANQLSIQTTDENIMNTDSVSNGFETVIPQPETSNITEKYFVSTSVSPIIITDITQQQFDSITETSVSQQHSISQPELDMNSICNQPWDNNYIPSQYQSFSEFLNQFYGVSDYSNYSSLDYSNLFQ
ncbi:2463_t:CDS:1, partial [Diversispora eburnea]